MRSEQDGAAGWTVVAVRHAGSYLDVRGRDSQLDGYYEPKAPLLRQRLRALKTVEVTLALAAAALATDLTERGSVGGCGDDRGGSVGSVSRLGTL